MRWRSPTRAISLLLLALACLSCCKAAAAPDFDHTLFENLPSKVVYFDDTTTVLLHDSAARNTWRSADEGKTWALVDGVPQGESWVVVEHPFDTTIAFILSKGKTHYRTLNRGQSWQRFEVPAAPALSSMPLAFHSRHWDWILYTGSSCDGAGSCQDETYYTQDGFGSAPKKLLDNVSKCIWAHTTKFISLEVPEQLLFCIAFEPPSSGSKSGGMRSLRESRLFSTQDFFRSDATYVDMGLGREARGLVGIGIIKGFIVSAMKPQIEGGTDGGSGQDEMVLYVTADGAHWTRVVFPHGHGLKENAYTIVESTEHSILVDVLGDRSGTSGTLFSSNSEGTYMTRSLEHTNRNEAGIVDFESLENVEGVSIANTVSNPDEVEGRNEEKRIRTVITYDDGGRWDTLQAPERDIDGNKFRCDISDTASCSLHLHSVTNLHNYGRVFSSTAPGIVMGVGSVGNHLLPYNDCDTFLSIDAGLTWSMVAEGAHKYEFGDQGSILVIVDDEEATDKVKYSLDFGRTWEEHSLGVTMRVEVLTTIPDSTSLKFLALGTLSRKSDKKGSSGERHVAIRIDFEPLDKRVCTSNDFEKWYARTKGGSPDCMMGHKLYFNRRKPSADCFVREKFKDPVGQEEDCACSTEDFECDYNYVPDHGDCILAGPEEIPAGQCLREGDRFLGSSGYRKIPGDTCKGGLELDKPKMKDCSEGQAAPGSISHKRTEFSSRILDQAFFGESHTLIAFCADRTAWQSDNEGFAWHQLLPEDELVTMTMHAYSRDRAYLITAGRTIHYTNDKGVHWRRVSAPVEPNTLGLPLLDFHPTRPDWLIWTGSRDCSATLSPDCHAVAFVTRDGGGSWTELADYVRTCTWARDSRFKIDERTILCEVFKREEGSDRPVMANPLELVVSTDYFRNRKTLFSNIVGFATFEEYMVVAALNDETNTLQLQVSMNGADFAVSRFPPNLRIETSAYTVLESVTDAVFLHVTTHALPGSEWGSLFKSNSNGTYYTLSLEHANRNAGGFVDFEKMVGLDGIALMNVVTNPEEASITGNKRLQTRITHNDGGRWKPLIPPSRDSLGRAFDCGANACALHLHGYTERDDPRATYSSPTAVGLMMAVGNVGVTLAPYADSDTFLTRDGGFTWEEVHKDAHKWEFGDQGSILVLVNDEVPTDRVSYSLDQGKTWQDYVFGEMVRARALVTVPQDTSRKFILMAYAPSKQESTIAIQLDFSKVTNVKCKLDLANPNADDFELWSPSEGRDERCLFGRQTMYYRRIRDRQCYIGEKLPDHHASVRTCQCTEEDYECEFNYRRDNSGKCVLVEGAEPLASEPTCAYGQMFWHERTNMRKIPYSSCKDGLALDQGLQHLCPASARHGYLFWLTILLLPIAMTALFVCWWRRRRGGGRIRLADGPINGGPPASSAFAVPFGDSTIVSTLASVPYWLSGLASAAAARLSGLVGRVRPSRRGGYRSLAVDDDAELLADYDEE